MIFISCMSFGLMTSSFKCRVFEAMEAMSKGIHRILVPIKSKMNHTVGVELTENSPGYHIFTEKDLVNFLYTHSKELDIMTKKSVSHLGAVHPIVFAAPTHMIVMDLVKCLRNQSLQAVPIVEGVEEVEDKEKEKQFIIVSPCAYLYSQVQAFCSFVCSST